MVGLWIAAVDMVIEDFTEPAVPLAIPNRVTLFTPA
jgi:hypothetical protein